MKLFICIYLQQGRGGVMRKNHHQSCKIDANDISCLVLVLPKLLHYQPQTKKFYKFIPRQRCHIP